MFVAIVPTILTLLLFVCLSWFRNWSLKSCKKTKGIEFLNGHPSTTLNETILPFSGTSSSEHSEESSEGASDVITKSSLLRILLFFVIVFLVSGCTVVVMVRNCFRTLYHNGAKTHFLSKLADRLPSVAFQLGKNPGKKSRNFFFAKSNFFFWPILFLYECR